ncbi:winged helix-turn-helix domain-containing protein [Chloroflexota bacterium]
MGNDTERSNLSRVTELDRMVHEPARLAVMSLLYVIESAEFTFVMNQTGLTWGNLSAHMSKLEEAGYIAVEKGYKGKRPLTTLSLSPEGRKAFKDYVSKMKNLFKDFPA